MKGIKNILNIVLIVYVICILGVVLFNIVEPIFFTKNSEGKKTTEENIYNVSHAVISKKYEYLLYEEYDKIYTLFSYNCKSKLKQLKDTNTIDNIIKYFSSFQITNIEVKNTNKYIIYYDEKFEDNNVNNHKMIIKYKDEKAIIYYDSILEAVNE